MPDKNLLQLKNEFMQMLACYFFDVCVCLDVYVRACKYVPSWWMINILFYTIKYGHWFVFWGGGYRLVVAARLNSL